MNEEMESFYKELKNIQDFSIGMTIAQKSNGKYRTTKDMLEDVTYYVISMMCELIDGYINENFHGLILSDASGKIINLDVELHDWLDGYLSYPQKK